MQGTTIFAFDASTRLPDGELAVVAWVNEIGLRFDGFEDFLDSVQAWLRAEVEATSSSSRAPEAADGPVQRSA
jgi:hypothetical protein